MKQFLTKTFYLTCGIPLLILMLIYFPSYLLLNSEYQRGQFSSNLFYINNNIDYDVTILGSSHARGFENCTYGNLTENILDAKVSNLAYTGGGVINQQVMLSYFYAKGNTTNTIVYFIDPHMLTSNFFDREPLFNKEPFKIDFLYTLLNSQFKQEVILSYIKSKLEPSSNWLKVNTCEIFQDSVKAIDSLKLKKRANYLAQTKSIDANVLHSQIGIINETLSLIEKHDNKVIFIIPPTLLGSQLGHKELILFLEKTRNEKGIEYYDLSNSMKTPKYYYNYDHLNISGMQYFLQNHLNPLVD